MTENFESGRNLAPVRRHDRNNADENRENANACQVLDQLALFAVLLMRENGAGLLSG